MHRRRTSWASALDSPSGCSSSSSERSTHACTSTSRCRSWAANRSAARANPSASWLDAASTASVIARRSPAGEEVADRRMWWRLPGRFRLILGPIAGPSISHMLGDSDSDNGSRTHWEAWHADYADPTSALSIRLVAVRSEIRAALDRWRAAGHTELLTVLSACAGDGRDILGVLAEPAYRWPATVSLLETDPRNLARAERSCREAGLTGVRLLDRDAG